MLPAKTNCAAQLAAADLITAINGEINAGNSRPVTTVMQLASPTGDYNLSLGTYDFTLAGQSPIALQQACAPPL